MDYKTLIEISSAALTPVVAIVTTYIAIQQYRSSKAKFRHDLYEKRLAIQKATLQFIVLSKIGQPKEAELAEFLAAIGEARYLFDKRFSDELYEIYYWGLRRTHIERAVKERHLEESELLEIKEIQEWFETNQMPIHERFSKYLNLKQLR